MIALEEARARLMALVPDPENRIELVPLVQAAGRVLMQDVHALRTQPVRDLSAMDGYAVSGLVGPWQVAGESAAGRAWRGTLQSGQAVRIFTGAVVPDGGDAVIMQEDVAREGDVVSLAQPLSLQRGKHIRSKGGDFSEGQLLLQCGTRLSPPRLALAAAAGHGALPVARTIQLALLSTGDELVPPGQACAEDQIPASNAVMLAALLAAPGVKVRDLGIIGDDRRALAAALESAQGADLIITIGGASVGDHDLVRPALIEAGAELDFWKVAIKPGKPLMAGRLGQAIVLGLPGNPVAAWMTALLFAKPVLAALTGALEPVTQRTMVPCGTALPANGNRTDHIRAIIRDDHVWPLGVNDSAALAALAQAECLIVRPVGAGPVAKGETTEILFLP